MIYIFFFKLRFVLNVSVVNGAILHCCLVCCFIIETVRIGSESFEFCVFNNEIIICNDGFGLKYELKCRYHCNILLSMAIDAASIMPTSTVNFHPIGSESLQIRRMGSNLFGVFSPTTIRAAISIEYENKMKYESRSQTQTQSQHATPHPVNKPADIDPTNATPGEFDKLEYMFDVLLSEDGLYCDINNISKYWCIKVLIVIIIVIFYASDGMLLFDF